MDCPFSTEEPLADLSGHRLEYIAVHLYDPDYRASAEDIYSSFS